MTVLRGRSRARKILIVAATVGAGAGVLWLALQLLIATRSGSSTRM